jgi:hypothetical protein
MIARLAMTAGAFLWAISLIAGIAYSALPPGTIKGPLVWAPPVVGIAACVLMFSGVYRMAKEI